MRNIMLGDLTSNNTRAGHFLAFRVMFFANWIRGYYPTGQRRSNLHRLVMRSVVRSRTGEIQKE